MNEYLKSVKVKEYDHYRKDRQRRHSHSCVTVTESTSAHACPKAYRMNEHREETKAMSTKHTFLILDILAENPTVAQEFSPSS